jgi:ketosteroid isomerase-like protein
MRNLRKKAPYRAALAAMVVVLAVACSGPSVGVDVKVSGVENAQATLDAALQADREFAAAVAKDGPKAAFLAWFHPTDSQFIDAGSHLKGAEAIAAPFEQSPPGFTIGWVPDSGVASASGDFATTTGRFAVKMGDQTLQVGRYMTSWRKDEAGAWKVVMDATIADPPAPPTTTPDPDGRPG